MAASSVTGHVSTRRSIVMLLAVLAANVSPNYAMNLPWERSSTCSSSSAKCSGSGLPDNFCCSSSTTCITLDSGSSVICCPEGQNCTYIQPITCDVTQQNATLYPDNAVKTTRLDDKLPTCGDACCPFGYTCQGSVCAMDDTSSTTSTTQSQTTQTRTTSSSTTSASTTSTSEQTSTSSSTLEKTSTPLSTSNIVASTVATESSSTTPTEASPTSSSYLRYSSVSDSNDLGAAEPTCPSFPTNAVLAGFFPGSVFGAVAALLLMVCIRRQKKINLPPSAKVAQNTHRKSTGTLMGISDPIPSDDTSFRTDFLLHTNPKRGSEGARSMLRRSRSRVKSLFGTGPKPQPIPSEPVPPLPFTPPRQRQPSMESIRVYTPPSVFANTAVLNPAPYPDYRPNTTLGDLLDQAQAASSRSSNNNNNSNSSNNLNIGNGYSNGNPKPRILLPATPKPLRGTPLNPSFT